MSQQKQNDSTKKIVFWIVLFLAILLGLFLLYRKETHAPGEVSGQKISVEIQSSEQTPLLTIPKLDTNLYDAKLMMIANIPTSTPATSTIRSLWPVKTEYPNYGALLPFNRIVAYYGNLYSKNMGILGEYSEGEVLRRLNVEVKKWNDADPSTPVIPAIHYIAVVAQAGPGKGGKYIARMPDREIDKALAMAEKINGIVFLDIQVGLSNVQTEIPLLEKYLRLPNVHLGIDPEFSMKTGARPGTVIGTLDAEDVNFATKYLANLVKENNLTPKVLVIHRFTQRMFTNYKKVQIPPEVQIVMNMDGFGGRPNKIGTYKHFIYREPVQFTGFKLFYKNDTKPGTPLLGPAELLKLTPIPVYIQYQ